MSPEHMLRTGCPSKTFDLRGSLSAQHLLILKTGTVLLIAVMKGNMMIFASVYLLLCWKPPVDSMRIHFNFTLQDPCSLDTQSIPLSMAEDSVDDMYFGCKEEMIKTVKSKYLEEQYTGLFGDAWKEAEECAQQKLKHSEDKALTKDHLQAICVYTSSYHEFYKTFDAAVRTNRSIYGSTFQFHSLHFLLTSAIQILNDNYHCHTSYRRTSAGFTGEVNQMIRFGFFASSSYNTNTTDDTETCFQIKTCTGAYLKSYSFFDDAEEVLIPPYEIFKITEIVEDPYRIQNMGLKSCMVTYAIESAGSRSNLNCQAAHM